MKAWRWQPKKDRRMVKFEADAFSFRKAVITPNGFGLSKQGAEGAGLSGF
jgi:hypothetical protein